MTLLSRLPLLLLACLSSCVLVVSDDGIESAGPWWHSERGSGVRIEEQRTVEAFHAVQLETAAHVHVRVGEAPSLSISGDDNVVPKVETRVRGGTLVIDLPGSWQPRCELELVLTTPSLEGFTVGGSGTVLLEGLAAQRLELAIEGSGNLQARGEAQDLHASIEGSGELELGGLKAERAELSIEGSGAIEADVARELHYSIDGSGSITQVGAAEGHGSIDGSGEIRRRVQS